MTIKIMKDKEFRIRAGDFYKIQTKIPKIKTNKFRLKKMGISREKLEKN